MDGLHIAHICMSHIVPYCPISEVRLNQRGLQVYRKRAAGSCIMAVHQGRAALGVVDERLAVACLACDDEALARRIVVEPVVQPINAEDAAWVGAPLAAAKAA